MSQEPKRRHSIARKGKRRAAIKLAVTKSVVCKNCQSLYVSHSICGNCGYYKGVQVVSGKTGSKDLNEKAQTV